MKNIRIIIQYIHAVIGFMPLVWILSCVLFLLLYANLTEESMLWRWTIFSMIVGFHSLWVWFILAILRSFIFKEKVFATYYAYSFYGGAALYTAVILLNPNGIIDKLLFT